MKSSPLIRPFVCAATTSALLLGLLATPAAAAGTSEAPATTVADVDDAHVEAVPGRIVISWDPAASDAVRADVRDRVDVRSDEVLDAIDAEVVIASAGSVDPALAALNAEPSVLAAEPDYVLSQATNDPGFGHLWGLHNVGQSGGTPDIDIDAPEAWATTRGDADVIVAVIDTGVDISHPDLVDNIWTNPGEIAGNGIDDDRNGYVDDLNGWDFLHSDHTVYDRADGDVHGTHVAGTIAAGADNGVGVAGVAPNVTVMALKFLDAAGSGSSSAAAAAVNYAHAHGATVINASWGGANSTVLKNAITGAPGAVLVAAAGNEGVDIDSTAPQFPAAWADDAYGMTNIVSVASVERTGALSSFSNRGPRSVDVGAPGGEIVSTLPDARYGAKWGTSMAAPHVSGVAALVASIAGAADGAALAAAVKAGAQPLPALAGKTTTGGLVNAPAALAAAPTSPVPTSDPGTGGGAAVDDGGDPETPVADPGAPAPETDPPATGEPPPYDGTGARSLERACPGVVDSGFSDVLAGTAHAAGVGCAAAWGVFSGSSDSMFRPAAQLTRGQLASVLARAIEQALGETLPTGPNRFTDDDGSVHRIPIDKLAELGIVAGVDATRYEPSAPVTRGQFATMLARTFRHLAGELPAGTDAFGDDSGLVHEVSINGLAGIGVVAGTADGRFQPGAALAREQSATLVARLLDALVEASVVPPRPL